MPKGQPIPVYIQQEILLSFDAYRRQDHGIMLSCTMISSDLAKKGQNISAKTIWHMLQRLRPSTDLAKMYLKAKAIKLARRIVRKANVSEAIDLLSRPDMGVISPRMASDNAVGGGFFLSVEMDTCGAVKIGAGAQVLGQLPSSPDSLRSPADSGTKQLAAFDPFAGVIEGEWDEPIEARADTRVLGRGETAQTALDRARAKIQEARARAERAGNPGISGADGGAEEEDVTVTSVFGQ